MLEGASIPDETEGEPVAVIDSDIVRRISCKAVLNDGEYTGFPVGNMPGIKDVHFRKGQKDTIEICVTTERDGHYWYIVTPSGDVYTHRENLRRSQNFRIDPQEVLENMRAVPRTIPGKKY